MNYPLHLSYYIDATTITYVITNLSSDIFKEEIVLMDSLLGSHKYGCLRLQPNATKRIDLPSSNATKHLPSSNSECRIDPLSSHKERLIGSGFVATRKGCQVSNVESNSTSVREHVFDLTLLATPNPYAINEFGPTIINVRADITNTTATVIVQKVDLVIANTTYPLGKFKTPDEEPLHMGKLRWAPYENKTFSREYILTEADKTFDSIIITSFVRSKDKILSNIASTTTYIAPEAPKSACESPPGPGINWTDCNKADINLFGVNLTGATLINTNFRGSNLSRATLSSAVVTSAIFDSADLTLANLSGTISNPSVRAVSFISANLSNAALNNAKLAFSVMTRARLNGANATNATFTSANFDFADLTSAIFTSALLQSTSGINALFISTNLIRANLANANFTGANFTNANLTSVNLSGTILTNAILNGVTSSGITGTPASLPAGWALVNGTLVRI